MTEPMPHPDVPSRAKEDAPPRLGWMPAFLAALAERGNIRHAARTAGIAQTTAYDARHRHSAFALSWDKALAMAKAHGGWVGELCAATPPEVPTKGASAHWRNHFFEALAETSSVTASAARAHVAPRTVYKLRREDAEFAERWRAALLEGYDHLEMELLGHLRNSRPGHRMDVASALRLLAAHRQTVERQRALREEDDEQATLDSIDRFIEDMRQRRLANTAILLEAEERGDGAE